MIWEDGDCCKRKLPTAIKKERDFITISFNTFRFLKMRLTLIRLLLKIRHGDDAFNLDGTMNNLYIGTRFKKKRLIKKIKNWRQGGGSNAAGLWICENIR